MSPASIVCPAPIKRQFPYRMAAKNPELKRHLAQTLEAIDAGQSKKGQPLHLRPFEAANLFVRHMLVSIDGDTDKNEYHDKPWFAAIYATTHEWYESKYGPLNVSTIDIYIGLVVHAGIPHSIAIPRTTSKIQPDGLVAVTFPSKLYADETPEKWLKPKIRLRSLRYRERKKLIWKIESACTAMRKIGLNTVTAGGKKSSVPKMASSIAGHLSKAASTVAASQRESNSLALWDLHLAAEVAIKSLLSQRDIPFPKTHDLSKLNSLLDDAHLRQRIKAIIRRLPSHDEAINHRYLEGDIPSIQHIYVTYRCTIRLCVLCTSSLRPEIRMDDASIFLQKPPWLSQLN